MTSIAKFCREHRLPQRRILRLVKDELANAGATGQTTHWEEDLSEEIGVRARRAKGHARVTYEVTDPEALMDWITDCIGPDLLSDEEFSTIVDAASKYYQIAAEKDDDLRLERRDVLYDYRPDTEYLHKLNKALRRGGW